MKSFEPYFKSLENDESVVNNIAGSNCESLEKIIEAVSEKEVHSLAIGYNRTLAVESDEHGARLRIISPNQTDRMDLAIQFSSEGSMVKLQAASLEIDKAGSVSTKCDAFIVEAKERIELKTKGDFVQKAEKNSDIEARNLNLTAASGAVRLNANDDIQLLGEMILLNCDRPEKNLDLVSSENSTVNGMNSEKVVWNSETSGDAEVIDFLMQRRNPRPLGAVRDRRLCRPVVS